MSSRLCITVRFLQSLSHGRGDGGAPEWPPSPLRLFQALVAASAARWNERMGLRHAVSALQWLERQPAPEIIAGFGEPSHVKYRLYVPDNLGDKVAASCARGGGTSIADFRTEKDVRPTHLSSEAVHYLYTVVDDDPEFSNHRGTLFTAAQSITHLGWGIDMVVANATVVSGLEVANLYGEHWRPVAGTSANALRIPIVGTLPALIRKHEGFLNRVTPNGFRPAPPLSAFRVVGYRRAFDPQVRPVAAFSLLKLDASGFRAFDTPRRSLTVAGMMRYIAKVAADKSGWPESKINAFILGHSGSNHAGEQVAVGPERFSYLPLPSIEVRGEGKARVVGSIRRVMISSFSDNCEDEIAWARRALSGQELINEDQERAVALLSLVPHNDKVVRYYTQPAAQWATVTPVILPGYDDPAHYRRRLKKVIGAEEHNKLIVQLEERIDGLLRKAIVQAGFSETLADHAHLEWRKAGFWPGTDMANRYGAPNHLRRFPRYHVKIHWRDAQNRPIEVPGPICIGGGRFYGLGLFAAL